MAERELWVAGYPSYHGGADTELLHQIVMLRRQGVRIMLVPMGGADPKMRATMDALGCFTREYRPSVFKGKVVVSFCNGNFLKALREIHEEGPPRAVLWANCMTWLFENEIAGHAHGWITHHLFQTEHQKSILLPHLEKIRPAHQMPYLPFYDVDSNPQGISRSAKPTGYYGIGRVSRDDGAKFSPDMWQIMDRVLSPGPKKVFVLGYGSNAHARCGNAPPGLDWATYGPGDMPVGEFYPRIHTMVHKTGGSGENLPRIMMEAWHSGTVLVCEDAYGFREHVVNGVNGFRCGSSEEMSYRASQLAFDPELRTRMVENGMDYLKNNFCDGDLCYQGWNKMFNEVLP